MKEGEELEMGQNMYLKQWRIQRGARGPGNPKKGAL